MIPNDNRRTNLTVDQTLVVGKLVSVPLIHVQELKVEKTLSIEDLSLDELKVNTIQANTVNSSNSNTTNGTFDTLTVTTLNATNANVTDEDVKNLTAQNIQAITTTSATINTGQINAVHVNSVNIGAAMTLTAPFIMLTNTSNQIVVHTANPGNTVTLTVPSAAASRTYTVPDVLSNASFVMTEGAQTINGVKTFTSAPVLPASSLPAITLTNVTNQITLGTGNQIVLTAPTPAATRTYTVPDVLANASFVMTAGAQTIAGAKTFSNGVVFGTAGGTPTNLNFYSEVTQTPFTLTGNVLAAPVNVTINLVRIGKLVILQFTGFTSATGGAASTIVSSSTINTEFRPAITVQDMINVLNSTSDTVGLSEVATTGVMTFYRASAIGNTVNTFAAAGTVGIRSFASAWLVA